MNINFMLIPLNIYMLGFSQKCVPVYNFAVPPKHACGAIKYFLD